MTDCGICLDKFNKTTRKKVGCPYCSEKGGVYCKGCVQTYMLQDSASDPRCPNPECRLGWSDDFLTESLPKTWLLGDYKKHREKILLDMEKARLPETQEDAGRYMKAKAIVKPIQIQIDAIKKEIASLPENTVLTEKSRELYSIRNYNSDEYSKLYSEFRAAQQAYQTACIPFYIKITRLSSGEYTKSIRLVKAFGKERPTRQAGTQPSQRSTWTLVMKCPGKSGTGNFEELPVCQGFIGLTWKCGLCELEICKECREPKETHHQCDPEKVLTAKALQKEAKPCPKCAAQISKIDGCDQMWCTQCQTAFSWRTGEIESNRVHNPHYYEWMRRNGGIVPAVGVPQNVDCLNPNDVLENVIIHLRSNAQIMDWCRCMRHYNYITRIERHHLNPEHSVKQKHALRVQKLANEIDDENWKNALQKMEKAQKKRQRVVDVLELYFQAGVDLLRQALLEDSDKLSICNQLVELRNYGAEQMEKIRKRYNNEVPDLHDFWRSR